MTDRELVVAATRFRENAYAPYSRFAVGAALLARSGRVYGGVNVENASYPVGICAERAAIARAVTDGEVMAEFPIRRVILANLRGDMHVFSPSELLPHAFGSAALPAKEESPT